uniref:Putative phosphate ABC transporter substrate-binding protein n=1 Tax=viral metagenome TaxID=1070528 RepID=A0A6H1ZQP6_9ZZZZ
MKKIIGAMIPKDISNQFWFVYTRDAFITGVDFILIVYCVAVIILAATLGYLKWIDPMNQKVVSSGYQNRTEEELKARHRHHGINHSRRDENHEWYFTRDGKRCKLFAAGKNITIKGSTTVLPIAQITAEVFMDRHPEVKISVQGGGSGVGIAAIIDGTCDIANASRSMKEQELSKAISKGKDPKANVIAMDGIAVIVHPSNKVSSLTKNQLKDIYIGNISDWSTLGGEKQKIVVISRDSASGTFESFGEMALDKRKVRADALMQASNQVVASTLAKTPGAIGYVGLGYVSSQVRVLALNGVMPSEGNVIMNKYILFRPLFMYTNGAPKGVVKDFIDFVLSEEGKKLIEEAGFIGVTEQVLPGSKIFDYEEEK